MTDANWQRLDALFHDALERSGSDRANFVADACGADLDLRTRLERLLHAHEQAGRFIEGPAIATPADLPDAEPSPVAIGRRFGAHRIVREIARGGMGAVYEAERADGEFRQRVAIKLIKRGMDTDAVQRRFRAERQILASLDHPYIVRLLDGGATEDGLPFFVMECIEGRPIDEYADSARLSVSERLQLFLKVCSAVSYAHRRLVIHRDIKPVNILVTPEGVPKLLDFGIAKVLDPEGAEATLTATGLRLLTPEYASPEQVAGRQATSASDVYSLGVVLYELLTGRSPYAPRSRDPLDVADAVRSADPERPSAAVKDGESRSVSAPRRAGLSGDRAAATSMENTDRLRRRLEGDLDTIVLKALRKEPERRYASVEDFADDVRRHLDGLPVRARPDSLGYRAGKLARRSRSTAAVAVIAGAAALIVAAALLAFRADRRGPASLLAAGAIAPRDRILVADFGDRAQDSSLTAALSDAFRVDIAQSPLIQVLSSRQVRSALQRMQRSPDAVIDDSLAREIAAREGVKAFVTGSVAKVAGRYAVTAQLVSAEKGDLLAALLETSTDSSDVIRAIDRLSERLRQRIGESLRSIRETPPLEQVTTSSLAALRLYSAGARMANSGERLRGIRMLQNAVALDTGFASAYRVIAIAYGDMVEPGRAAAAMDHAVANQARLPFYERYLLLATNAFASENYDAAVAGYRRILSRYPNDVRALNNMSLVLVELRDYATAESMQARAVVLDPTIPSIQAGLAQARLLRGDFIGARRALDTVEKNFPDLLNAHIAEIYLAAAQQDWPEAERRARLRLRSGGIDRLDSLDALETLSGIMMTQGRLNEAERTSRRVMSMAPVLASPARYLSSAIRVANIALRYRADTAAALALIDSALVRFPLDSIDVADRPYDDLARFFASARRPARARAMVTQAEHSGLAQLSRRSPNRRWSLGVIALAEGNVHDAVALLDTASATIGCTICALPDYAHALEAGALRDSAMVIYDRYLQTPWKWRFEPDALELGWSMRRLGELYEERGQPAKAVDAYERLVKLWSKADPQLQPVLTEARRRIARFQTGDGR